MKAQKRRRIRVVFYDEGAPGATQLGGGQVARLSLMEHLTTDRFKPILLTSSDGELAREARHRGIEVVIRPINPHFKRFPRSNLLRRPTTLIRTFIQGLRSGRRLAQALSELNADIVHPNENLSRVVTIFSQRSYWIPAVIHIDNEWNSGLIDRILAHLFISRFDRLIAVSRSVYETVTQYTNRMGKVILIPTGIDLTEYQNLDEKYVRNCIQIPSNVTVFATVGKLMKLKNQHLILRAIAEMDQELPGYRFLVIGDGSTRCNLESLAAELGLSEKVIFLGHRNDVPRIMAGVDFVIHASASESFGLVIAESLLCGRPVIATDVGETREFLNHGKFGWIIPPNNVSRLKQALKEAATMAPHERDRLGALGKAHVERNYNITRCAHRVEAVYESLLESRE